jgi:putative flippase GtrA
MTTTIDFPVVSLPLRERLRGALLHTGNWRQFARFAVVGVSGYLVNLGVYAFCLHVLGIDYRIASVIAYFTSVMNNFWLNRHWTFDARGRHPAAQGVRFFIVSLIAFGCSELLLIGMVAGLGFSKLMSQAIATIGGMPINFTGQKLWSFRH